MRAAIWKVHLAAVGLVFLATSAQGVVTYTADTVTTAPGVDVDFGIVVDITDGEDVIGPAVDFRVTEPPFVAGFEGSVPAPAACTVNPDIGRNESTFNFVDAGDPTLIRAGLITFSPSPAPLESGVTMFTCTATVPGDTPPGEYPIIIEVAEYSDSNFNLLTAEKANGAIIIPTEPTPTFTDVPPTVTNTPVPTNTPTVTSTRAPGGDDDDDGCQIAASGQGGSGWILLIPIAGLLWLRRRTR